MAQMTNDKNNYQDRSVSQIMTVTNENDYQDIEEEKDAQNKKGAKNASGKRKAPGGDDDEVVCPLRHQMISTLIMLDLSFDSTKQ